MTLERGQSPRWDAEVVSTAAALAMNDYATAGKLNPLTRQALDRMWTLQKPDGGFDWLKCGWPPYEHDDYYGAIVAALGVGHAAEGYALTPAAQFGVKRLQIYFSKNPAPTLHHRVMLMWASMCVEGLMTAAERRDAIARLRELQREDGGWNLPSLGDWKRHDGSLNDPASGKRRLRHGAFRLRPPQSGYPGIGPLLAAWSGLAAIASACLGTMVHPLTEHRWSPLHHSRWNCVCRARPAVVRYRRGTDG